jgi:hypothetical protein
MTGDVYYLQLFKGRPHKLGATTLEDYQKNDAISPHKAITPKVEIDPSVAFGQKFELNNELPVKGQIEEFIINLYQSWLDTGTIYCGPFGDLAQVTVDENNTANLNYIGQGAFIKPGLAVDLCIFVKGKNEQVKDTIYSVNIIRGRPPGKDKPALVGGFVDVAGIIWNSAIYTVLHECEEEGGMKMLPAEGIDLELLRTDYNRTECEVDVYGFGKPKHTRICQFGTFPTSEEENLPDGTKRVYATVGHLVCIDLGNEIVDEEKLNRTFKAGDDAKDMKYYDITKAVLGRDYSVLPEFGIGHHRTVFEAAIEKLREVGGVLIEN